jgi:hypothetical protein
VVSTCVARGCLADRAARPAVFRWNPEDWSGCTQHFLFVDKQRSWREPERCFVLSHIFVKEGSNHEDRK